MIEGHRFSPETGKPNPVSLREYMLMDRHEQRAFTKPLSQKEKYNFQLSVISGLMHMPLHERRAIQKELVAKLEARQKNTISDAIEVARAKFVYKSLMLPEKQPIFFRKLRSKDRSASKSIFQHVKSPYLITSIAS